MFAESVRFINLELIDDLVVGNKIKDIPTDKIVSNTCILVIPIVTYQWTNLLAWETNISDELSRL